MLLSSGCLNRPENKRMEFALLVTGSLLGPCLKCLLFFFFFFCFFFVFFSTRNYRSRYDEFFFYKGPGFFLHKFLEIGQCFFLLQSYIYIYDVIRGI